MPPPSSPGTEVPLVFYGNRKRTTVPTLAHRHWTTERLARTQPTPAHPTSSRQCNCLQLPEHAIYCVLSPPVSIQHTPSWAKSVEESADISVGQCCIEYSYARTLHCGLAVRPSDPATVTFEALLVLTALAACSLQRASHITPSFVLRRAGSVSISGLWTAIIIRTSKSLENLTFPKMDLLSCKILGLRICFYLQVMRMIHLLYWVR
jgi:hypothetical protein